MRKTNEKINADGKGAGHEYGRMDIMPPMRKKTRLKIREETVLENFPLFCTKCRQETISFVSYQRARCKDAEPITYELNTHGDRLFSFGWFLR